MLLLQRKQLDRGAEAPTSSAGPLRDGKCQAQFGRDLGKLNASSARLWGFSYQSDAGLNLSKGNRIKFGQNKTISRT